jgi:hypothetical protein
MATATQQRRKQPKAAKGAGVPASAYPLPEGGGKVYAQPMVAPKPKKGATIERHGTTAGLPGKAVTFANRWRENYNPLRQLPIRRAVELLEMAQRGDTALLQWTFRFIERRYPTLSALLSRCEAPLLNFDWEIKIKEELPPGVTDEMAKAQQASLKDAYDGIDNLKQAIQHLHLADFRGYAHIQKHRTNDGEVYHLETLDQWCVCRDGLYGDWFWNPDSRFVTNPAAALGEENRIGGDQLPREDFIIRGVDRPIDEIALVNFIRSNLCEKDWDGFIEIYGMPGGVVTMPPNVPQGKETQYETAAQQVAEGGSGAIPSGSTYEPNDGPRGIDPFTPRIKHLDEQLIMAGTGGKLTMLAESGTGTLAGKAHSDTFEDIADARADKISEIFQKEFDAEVLDRTHSGQPVLVYFKFGGVDKDSETTVAFKRDVIKALGQHEILARVLANQVDLKETSRDVGLSINEEYQDPYVPVAEANGAIVTGQLVKDPEGDIIGGVAEGGTAEPEPDPNAVGQPDDGKGPKGPNAKVDPKQPNKVANRASDPADLTDLDESGQEHYARAVAEDMQIVAEELESLLKIDDGRVLAQRAIALRDKIDVLKTDILHLPKSAQALAEVQIAALFTGLTEKRKK